MKKILIVMPSFLPVPAVSGGAVATLIESIIRENEKQKKIDISVFTNLPADAQVASRKYPSCNFIAMKEPFFLRIDNVLFKQKFFLRKICVIRQVKSLLMKNDYDVVVLENSGYLLKIFSKDVLLKKYEGKIFYHLHNDIPHNIDRRILQKCKLLPVSNFLMDKANKFFGGGYKFDGAVVKNGIDSAIFSNRLTSAERSSMRKELNISVDEKVVIFVGRIVPEKGVDKLIDAISMIDDRKIVLILVGSTYFAKKIHSKYEKEIAGKCAVMSDKIRHIGYVDNSSLWRYYNVADVAVLPSVWEEPAGLTMVEAAMSGIPVITTKVGGIPEYMSPPLAVLVENDCNLVAELKNSIVRVLSTKNDWEKQAEEYQKMFSIKSMYQAFLNALE